MKRFALVIAAVAAAFSVSAAATCKAVPKKTWTHTFEAAAGLGREGAQGQLGLIASAVDAGVSRSWWLPRTNPGNGLATCSWKGAEAAFDGLDGTAIDVSKYAGLAGSIKWRTNGGQVQNPSAPFFGGVGAYFYDKNCTLLEPPARARTAGAAAKFTFPKATKWAFIEPEVIGTEIEVTLSSPGKTCPKKKKK